LEDKTYLVKVSENRRLTPETYDRNVFHIAFDTTGTGLKYEVGEALGIHGWNDADEVREFIEWYGLDADELVSVPSPHDNGATYETRTVFQLMQQNLDVFGKPGKSFYASLAALAKNKNEERTLRFIAAPEGVALFKKMSEVETVTFADVLRQFKSARPSIEELVGLIPEIKPRHYSIASSNAAVGDLVELLIVTVDWATPSGTPRYGQCTRYLAGLPVGAEVTVSIKPSVMKLPPLDTQPIIMAGLGTGAAPFRAFIQHRAWQKSQGIEVGPLVYYFGSRYRSQEYLYVSRPG
jgi:sulfite reductase (NADPH) flavoprotein alpha-component